MILLNWNLHNDFLYQRQIATRKRPRRPFGAVQLFCNLVAGSDQQDAQHDAARHIQREAAPVAGLYQLQALLRESRKGSESTAETDAEEQHQLLRHIGVSVEKAPQ